MEPKNKGAAAVVEELPSSFTSQAGLLVDTSSTEWELAITGKGRTVDLSWLHEFSRESALRFAIMEGLIHISEVQAAKSVSTKVFALREVFDKESMSIDEFKHLWLELKEPVKKTLRGFLNTCVNNLQNQILKPYFVEVENYQYKTEFSALHPTKGRLSDYELDSILENLRHYCNQIPDSQINDLEYFSNQAQSELRFISIRKIVAYRLMAQIARRPVQIAMLKWRDILPVGHSFSDDHQPPIYMGVDHLHIRSFKVKQGGTESTFRAYPEKWSIPVTPEFSKILLKYRMLFENGLRLAMQKSGSKITEDEIQGVFINCPLIPDVELFLADWADKDIVEELHNPNTQAFHVGEQIIASAARVYGKGNSDRQEFVVGTNNRLRHTWLCNAALSGKPLSEIAKITNVTTVAARKYLQLGLKERQLIDKYYAANALLRKAFEPKPFVENNDIAIENELGEAVGVEKESNCTTCDHKLRMVRPIPCYGCASFRPLLEADHHAELEKAQAKRDFIVEYSGQTSTNDGSIKRLDKAISYIRATIEICDEMRNRKHSLGDLHAGD